MHPLVDNLSDIADAELHKTLSDLTGKLSFAFKMGNAPMVGQIQMVIESYRNELQNRNVKALNEMQTKSKQFKDIVDIQ